VIAFARRREKERIRFGERERGREEGREGKNGGERKSRNVKSR